ncbi:cell wall metabolism sensor histidine kinase WalK [Conexibacter sp. SYSU D00693]|uniref:sensor histidine kinase n=1 Tax=Conexibacter sp. SYSU D00693 TaxID=2812560 RepID=UPI00196A3997|nr:ATP-binding protein [Conexibacter sp. SYSU D00693]
MRPLDRLPSLKLRLGLLIVLSIVTTLVTLLIAAKLGLRLRWGALVALGVSLLFVQVVGRGLTRPLREMAAAADAMADGDHGVRVTATSRDEVGRLATSFNRMAHELAELDRLRVTLVADAAHELRTPIAALRASLENAVDGVRDADPAALLAQVDRLQRLADQLLDLSRLESGAAVLEQRRVEVASLFRHHEDVLVDVPDGLAIRGDPLRLGQVVDNLVLNAHRHAAGATVIGRARPGAAGRVRMEIEDDGPGLADTDLVRVFDRFTRTDASRSVEGSGLGLAIVRSIVELHGGAVHAERVRPYGLRLVLDLPAG